MPRVQSSVPTSPVTSAGNRVRSSQARTVRKDVERLRELGYPVASIRGPDGGYRFGEHGRLPALLLEPHEAVAVAAGLRAVSGVRGIEEPSALALAKLESLASSSTTSGCCVVAMPAPCPSRRRERRTSRVLDAVVIVRLESSHGSLPPPTMAR